MMPFVVMDAEVAATDINVLGSRPITLPATALMPICAPIVGLPAILGIAVILDLFRSGSLFFFGRKISLNKSAISYCLKVSVSAGRNFFTESMRNESIFRESTGATVCECTVSTASANTMIQTILNNQQRFPYCGSLLLTAVK